MARMLASSTKPAALIATLNSGHNAEQELRADSSLASIVNSLVCEFSSTGHDDPTSCPFSSIDIMMEAEDKPKSHDQTVKQSYSSSGNNDDGHSQSRSVTSGGNNG